jgi:hypothetical protein
MATLAAGYELEADINKRVLSELAVAAEAILADPTGTEAGRWLAHGMGKKIKQRVDAMTGQQGGIYGPLSLAAHGDARALAGLRAGGAVIEWGPRTTERTSKDLIAFAVGARDFAVLIERAVGLEHPQVAALDELLAAKVPDWAPDTDWSAKRTEVA